MGSHSARGNPPALRTRTPTSAMPTPGGSAPGAAPAPAADPAWYTELAHANSVIEVDFSRREAMRHRITLLGDVKRNPSAPAVWVVFLRFLNAERKRQLAAMPADARARSAMYRALLALYSRAVGVVPMTSTNRHSPVYLDLWLDLAMLQAEDPESQDEVRNVFKLIKMQRIGHNIPALYETWAAFEDSRQEHARANKLRAELRRCCPGYVSEKATPAPKATPAAAPTPKPSTPSTAQMVTPMPSIAAPVSKFQRFTPAPTSTAAAARPPQFRSDRKLAQPPSRETDTPTARYAAGRAAPQREKNSPSNIASTVRNVPQPRRVRQPPSLTRAKTSPHRTGRTETPTTSSAQSVTPAPLTSAPTEFQRFAPTPPAAAAATRTPSLQPDRNFPPPPVPRDAKTPASRYTSARGAPQRDSRTPGSNPSALRDVPQARSVQQPQALSRANTSPYRTGKTDPPGGAGALEKENVAPRRSGSPEIPRSATRPAPLQREPYDAAKRDDRYGAARRWDDPARKPARDDYDRAYDAPPLSARYAAPDPYAAPAPAPYQKKSPPLLDPLFDPRDAARSGGGRERARAPPPPHLDELVSPEHGYHRHRHADELRGARERRGGGGPRDGVRRPSPFASLVTPESTVTVNGRAYLVLGKLGKGGSSQVFKVLSEEREVFALKRVRAGVGALESYANEIALLRRLCGQPTVVQLHDAEVHRSHGLIHVVMECGEVDLAKLLSRKKGKTIPENIMRVYWEQMLASVHTIHEERIVHGDLKPANFLSVSGSLKLIDFGIAKAIVAEDTTKIIRDSKVGTPNYMSPEALSALDEGDDDDSVDDDSTGGAGGGGGGGRHPRKEKYRIGRASDIWSLGCILFQMVYGKTPFAHIRNTVQKLNRIQDPQYQINFRPIDNPLLLNVLRGCLQRDPANRLTMAQLLNHPYLRPIEMPPADVFEAGLGYAAREFLARDGFSVVCAKTGAAPPAARVEITLERMISALQVLKKADAAHGDDTATHSLLRLPPMTPTSSRITATALPEHSHSRQHPREAL